MKLGQAEYRQRRAQLMAQMEANSIAIVPTAVETVRNRDVEHPFRQDSDFYYLSGFAEANACLVLIPGREEGEYILFCNKLCCCSFSLPPWCPRRVTVHCFALFVYL